MTVAQKRLSFILLFMFTFIAASAGVVHWKMNHSLTEIIPGELYRSSSITPRNLAELASEHNIKTVIDLRDYDSDKHDSLDIFLEAQALDSFGIRHINLPTGQVPDMETVFRFLKFLDEPDVRPVLIHCHHGIGRTGLFVALYLIEYAGYTNEQARDLTADHFTLRVNGREGFRPDSDKGGFILNYQPRFGNRVEFSAETDSESKLKRGFSL